MSTIPILRGGFQNHKISTDKIKMQEEKIRLGQSGRKRGNIDRETQKYDVEYQKTIRSRNKPIREAKTYVLYTFLTSYYFVCSLKGI